MLLIHREPVVHPGHGEVHRDLQRLVLVRHLAHLPDGEGEVQVHVGGLVIREKEGRLFLVIVSRHAPGKLFGRIFRAC